MRIVAGETTDLYARVSRASDKRDESTASQIIECRDIAAERGLVIAKEWVDSSKSAWNQKVVRTGWEAMMARLEAGEVNTVIIFELSRFARRSSDGQRILAIADRGIRVIDSEADYDLTKARDRKTFRDAISANEFDSDMISHRTKRGKRHKVNERLMPNSSTRAFGFELGQVVPREEEAEILREAAGRLLAGEHQEVIVRDLNSRGVRTTLGNQWKSTSLRVALLRPANVGHVVHNGKIVHEFANPGILDRDVYTQLQALYGGRRRGRPTSNLATGFIRCECGSGMHAKELMRHQPYPTGEKARAYLCVKRDGGCGSRIDWFAMNRFLQDLTINFLSDGAKAAEMAEAAAGGDEELSRVRAEIVKLEQLAEELQANVLALGAQGLLTALAPINRQLVKLRDQASALVVSAPGRAVAKQTMRREELVQKWEVGDLAARRAMIKLALAGKLVVVSAGQRLDPPPRRCRLGV